MTPLDFGPARTRRHNIATSILIADGAPIGTRDGLVLAVALHALHYVAEAAAMYDAAITYGRKTDSARAVRRSVRKLERIHGDMEFQWEYDPFDEAWAGGLGE